MLVNQYFFSAKSNFDAYLYGPKDATVEPWNYYFSNESSNRNVCYEFKWLYGDSAFGVGFSNEDFSSRASYYSFNPQPKFQYEDPNDMKYVNNEPTLFHIKQNIPALACISVKEHLFTIIQNEKRTENKYDDFIDIYNPESVHIIINPGSSNRNDRLYLNFGRYPFKVPLPEGYEPFYKYIPVSCQNQDDIDLIFLSIMILTTMTNKSNK